MDLQYASFTAAETFKQDVQRAEKRAARNWRFRNIRSPESKVLTAVLTSVLSLFVR